MKSPPNEAGIVSGTHELIRDIGRSGRGSREAGTVEQHLMHLARDPLLVRDFMQGRVQGSISLPAVLPFHGWTDFTLSNSSTGGSDRCGSICFNRLEQYDSMEPSIEESIFPAAFEATVEDRREALDLLCQQQAEAPLARSGYRLLLAAIICTSFTIFLILLLVPA